MKNLFVFILMAFSFPAPAQVSPQNLFTPAEIRRHAEKIQLFTDTSTKCLQRIYKTHIDFHQQHKISKYYGDRRKDYRTKELREQALRELGFSEATIKLVSPQQEGISCIGLTMKCLAEGFSATGQTAVWNKIYAQLKVNNNFYGTDLQKMLRQLGWKSIYWNPDPAQSAIWDEEDRRLNPVQPGKQWNPVWGGHAYHYNSVLRKGSYYGIPVDDRSMLVGFKQQPPKSFSAVPFFVGIAHAGYHVFPGFSGRVIEGHSARRIDSINNLEISQFNPLMTNGGPMWTRTEKYRSGLIVIPPVPAR